MLQATSKALHVNKALALRFSLSLSFSLFLFLLEYMVCVGGGQEERGLGASRAHRMQGLDRPCARYGVPAHQLQRVLVQSGGRVPGVRVTVTRSANEDYVSD